MHAYLDFAAKNPKLWNLLFEHHIPASQAVPDWYRQKLDALMGRTGQRGVSYQAERIVRTEVQRVYSIALDSQIQSLAALVDNPKKLLKQWDSGPFRPGRREEHQNIDGQQVPVDQPFKLYGGAVTLMYPRDPSGPPGETINCGCTWIIVPESLVNAM